MRSAIDNFAEKTRLQPSAVPWRFVTASRYEGHIFLLPDVVKQRVPGSLTRTAVLAVRPPLYPHRGPGARGLVRLSLGRGSLA
jgi:hypothetical protein